MADIAAALGSSRRSGLGDTESDPPRTLDNSLQKRRVLLADDDEGTVDTFGLVLRRAGVQVVVATSGVQALDAARRSRFDCMVIDLRLGDTSGIDLLRALRQQGEMPPFLMISGWLSTAAIVQATKLGAFDVLEKPVDLDVLVASIAAAIDETRQVSPGWHRLAEEKRHGSVAERWAAYVLKGAAAAGDPHTLQLWAKESAVSYSTLCEISRLNGVRPLDARDFVRVLRALKKAMTTGSAPEEFLVVSDRRTLRSLSARAGVDLEANVDDTSRSEFLRLQQFVPRSSEALHVVSTLTRRW